MAIKIPRLPGGSVSSSGGGGGGGADGLDPPPSSPAPTVTSVSYSYARANALRDFYVEAQITASFDHPNILSCLGVSTGATP